MDSLEIEQVGLAAYLIMNESNSLIYKGYSKEHKCFLFESNNSEEFWANRYDLSKEKQHDQ